MSFRRKLRASWEGQSLQPNISREESLTIKELKENQSRIIFTADKGGCLGGVGQRRLHQEG